MSITSSHNQRIHSDLSELLAHYPELLAWLTNAVQHREEIQAEELLPAFLEECASQHISEDAYPFTAEDSGLNDIRHYLAAHPEISSSSLPKEETMPVVTPSPAEPREIESTAVQQGTHEQTPLASAIPGSTTEASEQTSDALLNEASVKHPEALPAKLANSQELSTKSAPTLTDNEPLVREEAAQQNKQSSVETASDNLTLPVEPAHINLEHELPASSESEEKPAEIASSEETASGEPSTAEQANERAVAAPDEQQPPETEDGQEATHQENLLSANEPAASQAAQAVSAGPPGTDEKIDASGSQAGSSRSSNPFRWWKKPTPKVRQPKKARRPRGRRQRIITWTLIVCILGSILVPAIFLISFGLKAYAVYQDLNGEAHSAVGHLLNVKKIFSGDTSHLNGLLDTTRLRKAQQEFLASERDFQQLQQQLGHSETLNTIIHYFPSYQATLASAQLASAIGIDIAQIGQIGIERAIQLAPTFSGQLLAHSDKPLITQPILDTVSATIDEITPLLRDIQTNASKLSLNDLPISAQEKAQIEPLLAQLPQALNDLGMVRNLLGTAGWLLGVAQPRTFLVQTMDRAELRGSGGFTGQYGEMTIDGGRLEPFSLKDISLIEYVEGSANQGQLAPEQYQSWWPFANWGLRDSNISADFPTTAQLAINLYKQETGKQVDGVMSFTPVVIEHVLSIIGPISVPGYNVTVTPQNLEDILHFYQLDNSGIHKQKSQQPDDEETSTRKRFTNNLASLFMDRMRAATPAELLAIAHQVLYDLKTKDLQMYFTDSTAEHVLMQYGYAAQIDRSSTHDGFYVVQQNLSASKASQYVSTSIHDTITLDSKGGATHLLQLRLVYNQAGQVYGYDTYYDYLRVYVPTSSRLLWGSGFSSGTPLCGGTYGSCPANNVFPHGELICPSGQYEPGASPPSLSGSDGATFQPLQTLGGPTNTDSDEPGRNMYGGWVIIPKNCTMNVTLSWYVPPLSDQPYSILVQRQAGTFADLDLTILPSNCVQQRTTGLHFMGILTGDTSFTVPGYHPEQKAAQSCYPQSGT